MTKTCGWCRFYARDLPQWAEQQNFVPGRDSCWVDEAETTQFSTCEAWTEKLFLATIYDEVEGFTAHEKAELLRVKTATYRYSTRPGPWARQVVIPARRRP